MKYFKYLNTYITSKEEKRKDRKTASVSNINRVFIFFGVTDTVIIDLEGHAVLFVC